MAQHEREVAARTVAREHNVPRAVAEQHEMIPRAQRVLDGGGVGMLGRETVFKAQHVVARDVRELGCEHARVAEVAARVAAAVAVENGVTAAVRSLEPHPRGVHAAERKFLVVHAGHRRGQPAEDLLTAALMLQLLLGHGLGRARAVQRLERAHQRIEARALGLVFLLFQRKVQLVFHRYLLPVIGLPACIISCLRKKEKENRHFSCGVRAAVLQ